MSARPDAARPDWASGPEWEGWKWCDLEMKVYRSIQSEEFPFISIYSDRRLSLWSDNERWIGEVSDIEFNSPADALEVANLIAEKLGGWGE